MVLSPDMAFFLGIHPRTDFTLKSLWELLDVRKRADDPEKCNQTLIETDHLKIWLFGKPLQDWTTVARVVFYLSATSSVLHLAAITVPRYRLKVGISLSQSEITAKQGQIKSWATQKKKKPFNRNQGCIWAKNWCETRYFHKHGFERRGDFDFLFALSNIVALTCFPR